MCLGRRLYDDLNTNIFDEAVVEEVEKIRSVCDLKSLAKKSQRKWSCVGGNTVSFQACRHL